MNSPSDRPNGPSVRRKSVAVKVGHVTIGGGSPIVVQSMTNTDTADIKGTAEQVAQLARAGSEIVRITVDRKEAAAAVPQPAIKTMIPVVRILRHIPRYPPSA